MTSLPDKLRPYKGLVAELVFLHTSAPIDSGWAPVEHRLVLRVTVANIAKSKSLRHATDQHSNSPAGGLYPP